jgi:hypothetical protein
MMKKKEEMGIIDKISIVTVIALLFFTSILTWNSSEYKRKEVYDYCYKNGNGGKRIGCIMMQSIKKTFFYFLFKNQ